MQIIYKDEGAEFAGDTGSITGTAVYNVTIEHGMNADIGGRDGWECLDVELAYVQIDALHLSVYQVSDVCGEPAIERAEEAIAEKIAGNAAEYVGAA